MTTYLYGCSDDLVEAEGDVYEEWGLGPRYKSHFRASNGVEGVITYDSDWYITITAGVAEIWDFESEKRAEAKVDAPDYTQVLVLEDLEWLEVNGVRVEAR